MLLLLPICSLESVSLCSAHVFLFVYFYWVVLHLSACFFSPLHFELFWRYCVFFSLSVGYLIYFRFISFEIHFFIAAINVCSWHYWLPWHEQKCTNLINGEENSTAFKPKVKEKHINFIFRSLSNAYCNKTS